MLMENITSYMKMKTTIVVSCACDWYMNIYVHTYVWFWEGELLMVSTSTL